MIGGLALLLIAGIGYASYLAGTLGSPSKRAEGAGGATDPTAGLADALKTLGLGGMGALTAFELQEIRLHVAVIPPEQADIARAAGLPAGAVVLRVDPGSAKRPVSHVGDVVVAINGQKITTPDDMRRAARAIGPGKSRYLIRRGEKTWTVEIDCPTCTKT